MDELERLGRNAFERVREVAEQSLDRIWMALQPLIEQMFVRMEALTILLRLIAFIFMHFWLEIALEPAFDELGKGIAEGISRMILIALVGGFLLTVLVIAVSIILALSINRSRGGSN